MILNLIFGSYFLSSGNMSSAISFYIFASLVSILLINRFVVKKKNNQTTVTTQERQQARTFSVEPRMCFVIERTAKPDCSWKPEFDTSEIQLLSTKQIRTQEGSEVQEFTFQAPSRKGILHITLVPEYKGEEEKEKFRKNKISKNEEPLRYTKLIG